MLIHSLEDLAAVLGANEATEAAVQHRIYKDTDCGAGVEFTESSIVLGSIVEGTDWTTPDHILTYPFSEDDLWATLQAVEQEAEAIWNVTHDEDGNELPAGEWGEYPHFFY